MKLDTIEFDRQMKRVKEKLDTINDRTNVRMRMIKPKGDTELIASLTLKEFAKYVEIVKCITPQKGQ